MINWLISGGSALLFIELLGKFSLWKDRTLPKGRSGTWAQCSPQHRANSKIRPHPLTEGGGGDHESEDFVSSASCLSNPSAGHRWESRLEGNNFTPWRAACALAEAGWPWPRAGEPGDGSVQRPLREKDQSSCSGTCHCAFLLSRKLKRRSLPLLSRQLHFLAPQHRFSAPRLFCLLWVLKSWGLTLQKHVAHNALHPGCWPSLPPRQQPVTAHWPVWGSRRVFQTTVTPVWMTLWFGFLKTRGTKMFAVFFVLVGFNLHQNP